MRTLFHLSMGLWMGVDVQINHTAIFSLFQTSRFENGSGLMVGSNAETITFENTMKNAKNDRRKLIILADLLNLLD